MTHARAKPIYIKKWGGGGSRIKYFRQAMGVTVIGLVEVLLLMKNRGY